MRKRENVAVYHEVVSRFLKSNLLRLDTPELRIGTQKNDFQASRLFVAP
jgi:hypothetical protein